MFLILSPMSPCLCIFMTCKTTMVSKKIISEMTGYHFTSQCAVSDFEIAFKSLKIHESNCLCRQGMVDCRPSVCLIYVIFERISHIHHIFISFRGNSFAKFALLRLFFTNHSLITTFFLLNSGVSIVSEHLHNLCNNS